MSGMGDAGEPLNLGHQAFIDAALAWVSDGKYGQGGTGASGEQALSDPMFANLYLFRHVHSHRFLAGPLPCVSGTGYDGARYLLPLFELHAAPVEALRERLAGHDCFYPLAQHQVGALDVAIFEWTSARDDADYLYPAEQFRHYRGTALNKKRNLVTQLLRAHEVTVEPYAVANIDDALAVLASWMSVKAKASGEADEAACTEALQLAPTLGLQGFVHRVDGMPAGFVLAQPMRHGVWVMRFAKGLDRFKGIYQHMFQHFCLTMPGVQWLNFEQDMGVANFRRSKLSYQPSALIPKYRVRLR